MNKQFELYNKMQRPSSPSDEHKRRELLLRASQATSAIPLVPATYRERRPSL